MTAIAAIAEDGKVYMGGDSAGVGGLSLTVRRDVKVFKNGPFIMGFTTSFRMGQLLHYAFEAPEHPDKMSDECFLSTVFIDAVRKCLKDGGYAEVDKNQESGGTFLLGYKGILYRIGGDYQVGISACDFDAVGCGHDLCKGSLHATHSYDIKPERRIKMALEAAEAFSAGVRGPFTVLSL